MSQPWPPNSEDTQATTTTTKKVHLSRPSLVTNASGIATSTLSFASYASSTVSVDLNQFPIPPPSVPTTPTLSMFHGSPISSNISLAATAASTEGLRQTMTPLSISRTPQSQSQHQQNLKGAGVQSSPLGRSPLSQQINDPLGLSAAAASESSSKGRSDRPLPSPPPDVQRARPGLSTRGFEKSRTTHAPGAASTSQRNNGISAYDWHEGSSQIDNIDSSEARMLSTSFITGLLAASDADNATIATDAMSLLPSYEQASSSRSSQVNSYILPSPTTFTSEISYPPNVIRFPRTVESPEPSLSMISQSFSVDPDTRSDVKLYEKPDADKAPSLSQPPPPQQPQHHYFQTRNGPPPPSAYANPEPLPQHRPQSALSHSDSVTLYDVAGVSHGGLLRKSINLRDEPLSNVPRDIGQDDDDLYEGVPPVLTYRQEAHGHAHSSPLPPPSAIPRSNNINNGGQPGPPGYYSSRQSIASNKSTKSYVSSLISRIAAGTSRSAKQVMPWMRKPLPPVPRLPNMTIAAEQQQQRVEASMPLPELAERAAALSNMLDHGRRPHHSIGSIHASNQSQTMAAATAAPDASWTLQQGGEARNTGTEVHRGHTRTYSRSRKKRFGNIQFLSSSMPDRTKAGGGSGGGVGAGGIAGGRKKFWIIGTIVAIIFGVGIAVGLVVGLGRQKGGDKYNCSGNMTGTSCNLDATCVCTSSTSGSCLYLAQNLVTLTPTLNTLFNVNWTTNYIANALWQMQGTPTGDCSSQALLVDVATGMGTSAPNRTDWAQSALLWNAVLSQDSTGASKMKSAINGMPWLSVSSADYPAADPGSMFAYNSSAFVFDFAQQTLEAAVNATFVINGQPSSDQISRVTNTAPLDRMYTYALAAATQSQNALSKYWINELQQDASQLSNFLSELTISPVMLPFDSTLSPDAQPVSNLLTNSTTTPFPPPLACYPGLNSSQLSLVNALGTTVFDLTSATSPSSFNISCYPEQPIYGILDVMRLRLPFYNSETDTPQQAAVLHSSTNPRVVVRLGELMSPLPTSEGAAGLSTAESNPLSYGVLNNFDHVVYNFLLSMDTNTAMAFVEYILSSPALPPTSNTLLSSLSSIPKIEVAVFGTVEPGDIDHVVSSYSTPTGNLFFGSDQAAALRNWALNGTGTVLKWAQNATDQLVVYDNTANADAFVEVWDPAYTYLHSSNPGVTVNVGNITQAFQDIDLMAP